MEPSASLGSLIAVVVSKASTLLYKFSSLATYAAI
jgi:hypothetical protein